MASSILQWLRPNDLSRLASLQLLAKKVVEGLRGGVHRSRNVGASVDFKEHRQYVPGDEVRSIDWKLYGKTDRLYIRQFEDETNLRCTLFVDQSGSMRYGGSKRNGISKHDYAIQLAACLAYLLIGQQDAVGVATYDQQLCAFLPARSHPNHLHPLLDLLSRSEPRDSTDISSVVTTYLQRVKRGGMVILLSDGFGDPEALVRSLALLNANQHEVIFLQVLDDDEIDFPFFQRTQFRALEGGVDEKLIEPTSFRQEYLKRFGAHQEVLASGCQKHRIHHVIVRTSEAHGEVLTRFLNERKGLT